MISERILVAEPSAATLRKLRCILGLEGYVVLEAASAPEAVALAARENPDLILLETELTGGDGYQVCAELKNDVRTVNVPVLLIARASREVDRIRGLEAGAADFLAAPFESGEVLARVRNQLRISQLTKLLIDANESLLRKQKRLDDDLRAAALIQHSLIPSKPPAMRSVAMAWRFLPCHHIGGDLFNVHRLDPRTVGVYLLDVSGHGVPAAMVTVSVSQSLVPQAGITKRIIGSGPGARYEITQPGEVLKRLDDTYPLDRFSRHFTICYLLLDAETGAVRYSTAGHPAPILQRRHGKLETLDCGGTIIGIGAPIPFSEGSVELAQGDRLFLYTDGLIELADENGSQYGSERLHEAIEDGLSLGIDAACGRILDDALEHARPASPLDDISLLGIEYLGS